ncbi:hypothetical protein G7Z17_g8161 [Cylindrodendrum hubeiense]|uniref:Homeobox domain-containing protein n=1 Tax=Cylindrodendrum hubeiense TaxID=595255 RepID=A0A9P5H5R5_9HYPO|nr:hypothetical protein G7Z17_g8161 [Cylindrodendrum hubeiense]
MASKDIFSDGTDLDFSLDNPLGEDLAFLSDGYIYNDTGFDSGDPDAIPTDRDSWLTAEISAFDFVKEGQQNQSIEGFPENALQGGSHASSAPGSLGHNPSIFSNNLDHVPNQNHAITTFPGEMIANTSSFSIHDTTQTIPPSKSGTRFNREAVRILKHWLSTHNNHPYPDEVDRSILQEQTGLNRTQIANWLANARRRGKVPASRTASRPQSSSASPIDIPPRPATPAVHTGPSQMNPLERWVDSPPENEPASATAIARAVASTSNRSPTRGMIGKGTSTRSIYRLSDGYVPQMGLEFLNRILAPSAACSVGRQIPMMPMFRAITTQHVKIGHFKSGKTMADWKGDWGFDSEVLALVENAIPPYFINTERSTPFPFEGSRALAETPRSAYELLKLELAYFMQTHFDKNSRMPSSEEMQLEACRIVLASEVAYQQDAYRQEVPHPPSWLQDLIMSADEIVQKAKFSPMRTSAESRLFTLRINGKTSLFEECPFEAQLHYFVQLRQLSGFTTIPSELKEEACCILGRMEEVSTTPSDFIATWLVKLIHSPADWLSGFLQRAEVSFLDNFESQENLKIDATIQDYTKLERELAKYLDVQRAIGIEPTDEELRRQARIIIYDTDIAHNQTAADDNYWLSAFKGRHVVDLMLEDTIASEHKAQDSIPMDGTLSLYEISMAPEASNHSSPQGAIGGDDRHSILAARSLVMKAGSFFVSDPNFYRWITEELARWVAATMSSHNPACHVPTDAEIQHYARWITYNE